MNIGFTIGTNMYTIRFYKCTFLMLTIVFLTIPPLDISSNCDNTINALNKKRKIEKALK